jgi:hypothetical protein
LYCEIHQRGPANKHNVSQVEVRNFVNNLKDSIDIRTENQTDDSFSQNINTDASKNNEQRQEAVIVTESQDLEVGNHDCHTKDHRSSCPDINVFTSFCNKIGFEIMETEETVDS